MLKYLPKPSTSFLQWHITERCNLRCKHCYQESYETPELPIEKLYNILDQYIDLLNLWNIKGRIQVTGGEPFVRNDLFDLLERIYCYRNKVSFGIMSNGFYVTKDSARKLKEMNIDFFQVSIEGGKEANDNIRGIGSYERIKKAAEILVGEGIRTSFSFTSHKLNWQEYQKVIDLGKEIGVDTVWSDRLVPWGAGEQIRNQMLQPNELKSHYNNITKRSNEFKSQNSKTNISTNRTLYFMSTKKEQRHHWDDQCDAVGTRGITILPQGDVLPCRRLPMKVGNLQKQTLFEIWYGSNDMWLLRDKNNYRNPICGSCEHFDRCGSGAPCVTYGYAGTPFATDPQCWKAFDEIPDAEKLRSMVNISTEDPDFWEHIIVQDDSKDLGEYLEIKDKRLIYHNSKKIEIEKSKNKIDSKNLLLEIDENAKFNNLINDITSINPETMLISFSEKLSKENLICFLSELKNKNINFKLTKPLPREWFGFNYYKASRTFNFPASWQESLDLFTIENDKLNLPDFIKTVPELRFIKSRNQIYEYFNYFNKNKDKKSFDEKHNIKLIQIAR